MRTALLLLPLLFAAACGRICHGPGIPAPAIWLDASAWFAAHHGDTLNACVDNSCRTVSEAEAKHPADLPIPLGGDGSATMHLTVTDPSGLHVSRDFTPVRQSVTGACGTVSWWQTPAKLTADGRLQPG